MNKFNILTDAFPDSVILFEREYPVHTSFRNWIKIACLSSDDLLKDDKKVAQALSLCYKDSLPPNIVSSFLGMMTFLNRGTDLAVPQGKKEAPVFSFNEDGDVIYSAFYSKYGIDLMAEDMHWYKFCALFSSLSSDNSFQEIIKIRTFDESTIKDSAKRRKIADLKAKFSLHENSGFREVNVAEHLAELF